MDLYLKLNSTNAAGYNLRGLVKAKKCDWEGSMGDYNKAIEINPKLPKAYLFLGYSKVEKNDFKGVLQDYDNGCFEKSPFGLSSFPCAPSWRLSLIHKEIKRLNPNS